MGQSRRITRKSASNLALAFAMLPRARREAMSVLYAFCRQVDDIADEDSTPPEARRQELGRWRDSIRALYGGKPPRVAVISELGPVIAQYPLELKHFEELLDGVEMDLEKTRYGSWEELELYCYRVASVVGLLSIEIFGYKDARCRQYAVDLGKALQLTNILRDVRNDAARGRIYLPKCELARFGVPAEQLLGARWSKEYAALASAVADRAQSFYVKARHGLPEIDRKSMIAAELMASVYWRLLMRLRAAHFDVFGENTIRLSKPRKAGLVAKAWVGYVVAGRTPQYGPAAG